MTKKGDIYAVIRREIVLFASHKTFSRLAIGLPIFSFIFFTLLFKTGVPREFPIAVIDDNHTAISRKLEQMIDATPSAKVAYNINDMAHGEQLMKEGKVDAIVYIPKSFERDIYSTTKTTVVCYINGLNLTKNGLLNKDLQGVINTFSAGIKVQTLMKGGYSEKEAMNLVMPIYYENHTLFNPYVNYSYYLLPTFLPLMLMLFILLTTIFTIGVEIKTRSVRHWMNKAGNDVVIALVGKLAPYTVIFFALYVLMNTVLFKFMGVPLKGSLLMITISGIVYILAYQSIGVVLISVLANMRLALSIGGGYSVLAFTFSGLTFPLVAMSPIMHMAAYIFPLTLYIDIFIDQALRGAPVIYTMPYLGYMMLFMLLAGIFYPRIKTILTNEKYWGRL